MEDVRWPAEQLEEHRLEISNRIRNLFWTVSGDYDMEFEPDTEKYVYSKQTVLYEAVKQGAFARYFDQKKLGMYLMKKIHFSAGEDILLPLAGLCMDAAVNRFIIRERLGTKEIREQAFRELEKAEEEQCSCRSEIFNQLGGVVIEVVHDHVLRACASPFHETVYFVVFSGLEKDVQYWNQKRKREDVEYRRQNVQQDRPAQIFFIRRYKPPHQLEKFFHVVERNV